MGDQAAAISEWDDALKDLREGQRLYSIPARLRCDKDLVLLAIENEGAYCFDYITDDELRRCDRDVVLALVTSDGSLLEEASEELRADRQIVLTAVKTSAAAIKFASKELQADKQVQRLAVNREK